jgi:hypothetical protein
MAHEMPGDRRDPFRVVIDLVRFPILMQSNETCADFLTELHDSAWEWNRTARQDRRGDRLLDSIERCKLMIDAWPTHDETSQDELITLDRLLVAAHERVLWNASGMTSYDYATGTFDLSEERLREIEN